MKIVGLYSFAHGREFIEKERPGIFSEVEKIISEVDGGPCKTKKSKEKTMKGRMLYSPIHMNEEFVRVFVKHGWDHSVREYCSYPTSYYVNDYKPGKETRYPFRDMDFVKQKVGCEVQFGKYSFMVYNVCAKMTIFRNLGHIECGIEIVPVKSLAEQMSTGVSYFEQFVWDLDKRGVADIDVPVLIIGIAC